MKLYRKYSLVCLISFFSSIISVAAVDDDVDELLLEKHQIQANVESITIYLRSVTSDDDKLYRDLIDQMGNVSFTMREKAQQQLLLTPKRYLGLIDEASKSNNPEIRARAGDLLKALKLRSGDDHSGELLVAIARVIEKRKLKGLTELLIATLPLQENDYVQMQLVMAARASASSKNRKAVVGYLESDCQAVRVAGVQLLDALVGSKQELADLLNDADPRLCFEAAFALANGGDRRGLMKLVELLSNNNVRVRQQSVRMLRALTAKNFGYNSAASVLDASVIAGKWRAYVLSGAAGFDFPIKRPWHLTAGLAAHYTFDDGGGDKVQDRSGGECHGRLVGAKFKRDRERGHFCEMSGGQHVTLPGEVLSGLRTGTVAAWVRMEKVKDQQILNCVYKAGGEDIHVQFRTGDTGCLFAYLGSLSQRGLIQSDHPVKKGEWIFAVFTWAADRGAIYLDGERIAAVKDPSKSLFIPKTKCSFWIGRDTRMAYSAQDLRGALDEMMIFNRELTAIEIRDLHKMKQ